MKALKCSILLLISTLGIPFQAQNCIDYPMNSAVQVNHVFPDLLPITELFPFVYDLDFVTHSSEFFENQLSQGDKENLAEWMTQFEGSGINKNDLYFFLYQLGNQEFQQHKDQWRTNNPALAYAWKNNPELATYLEFAKDQHVKGSLPYNYWLDFTISTQNHHKSNLDSILVTVKNPWVKRRYAYWKIVDSYYQHLQQQEETSRNDLPKQEALTIWENYFDHGKKDWLYYSAFHYIAQLKGNEALFECFRFALDKRARTARLIDKAFLEEQAKASPDAKKQASALVLIELKNPGHSLPILKRIYQLDPTNRDLNFLILRELNKIENWILTKPIAGQDVVEYSYWDEELQLNYIENHRNDKHYLVEFSNWIKQLKQASPESDKVFLSMLEVYCTLLLEKPKEAKQAIQLLKNQVKEPKMQIQIELFEVILDFQLAHGRSVETEKKLMELTQSLSHTHFLENPTRAIAQVWRTCGMIYRKHRETEALGFLMTAQTDLISGSQWYYLEDLYKNASTKGLFELIKRIEQDPATEFEKFVCSKPQQFCESWRKVDCYPMEQIKDYYGMRLVRSKKMKEAYVWYSQFSDEELGKNPFSYIDNDPFIFRTTSSHPYRYNKRDFLMQYLSWEAALKENPNQPELWFYLGNAHLNMSHEGNSWPMVSNHYSSYDSEQDLIQEVSKEYVYGTDALPFYNNALKYSKDAKLSALVRMNMAYILYRTKKLEWHQEEGLFKSLCVKADDLERLNEITVNCDVYADYLNPFIKQGHRIAIDSKWAYGN